MTKQNGTTAPARPRARGTESIKDSLESLAEQGGQTLDTVKSRVADVTEQARTKSSDVLARTIEAVKANPFRSVAIAFGAGYVLTRIKRSPLTPFVLIGGLGYLGNRLLRSPS